MIFKEMNGMTIENKRNLEICITIFLKIEQIKIN